MITGVLVGKENLVPFLRTFPNKVESELATEIERIAIAMVRKVKAEKLSGQVLRNRTGTLRASINYRMDIEPRRIFATVGTNKEYAAFWEYGFSGDMNVREHQRMMVKVFGRPVKDPHQITVRAHTRNINIAPRSFLRSTLEEMRADTVKRIEAALRRAAAHG